MCFSGKYKLRIYLGNMDGVLIDGRLWPLGRLDHEPDFSTPSQHDPPAQ
jgi:hypothetical protein